MSEKIFPYTLPRKLIYAILREILYEWLLYNWESSILKYAMVCHQRVTAIYNNYKSIIPILCCLYLLTISYDESNNEISCLSLVFID